MTPSLRPVTAKDIMQLLECSKTTAYRKLKKIKEQKSHPQRAIITFDEFCEFYEIKKAG